MSRYETIRYDVVKKDGSIELRTYDQILLASTKTYMHSDESGFGRVFRYISGHNENEEKISMTTPVVSYQERDELITGFYVPSKYDIHSVPKPKSNHVFINDMKPSLYAVIKFRGRWNQATFDKYDERLKHYIERHGYKIDSPRLLFRYHPPFVPPLFRRNELAYKIK